MTHMSTPDAPWVVLLTCQTAYTVVAHRRSCEPVFFYIVHAVQAVCFANLAWKSRAVQQLAHDAFAAFMLYALLASRCTHVRRVGVVTASLQAITRWWYDRCIFLWWNVGRNRDADVTVIVLCFVGALRRRPLVPAWACVLVGVASRALPDGRNSEWFTASDEKK